ANPPSTIPTEICLQIFQLCSKEDLRDLTLVSRFFRRVCQLLLFQDQALTAPVDVSDWVSVTESVYRSKLRLINLAASSHASTVRKWSFHGNSKLASWPRVLPNIPHIHLLPETYIDLLDVFRTTVGLYRSLRSLRLSDLDIDPDFRRHLACLERLQDLHMSHCTMSGRTGPLLELRRLTLTSGSRHSHGPSQPIQLVSPGTIRNLSIDSSDDACALLESLGKHTLSSLTDLTVRLSDLATERSLLFDLLEHCPHLTRIDISRPSTLMGSMPISLPSTAIPSLKSFKGSRSLAGLFMLNRPVAIVDLADHLHGSEVKHQIVRALADISQSSVPLHSLSLDV
ncbi:hypothetical protein C8R43DRAFT_821086, partial [Mycena crocata]